MNNSMIDKKIKIIRDFKSVKQPEFNGNDHAMPYVIWNLYNRVSDAIKSFLVLLDNQRYYDAFIIAGHALETCAVLSYIKDNKTEAMQLENYNKYIAYSAANRLFAILEMSTDLENPISWNAYATVLTIFYPVGKTIINSEKNAEEKHKEIIDKLNSRLGANEEKIKLIKKSYILSRIQDYISALSKNMENADDREFQLCYTKYCNYKHCNMMAPGTLAGDIDYVEVDRFVNLILVIVLYLDNSKLDPVKPCCDTWKQGKV